MHPRTGFCSIVLLTLLMAGCGGHVSYDHLDRMIAQGNCQGALGAMAASEKDYPKNDRLLWLMDSAMVQMRCRDFGAAQKNFRAAEDLARELWTKSVSKEAAAFLLNDYVLPYAGEDFEQAMIHLMSALAYADGGQPEEALVECRRLDSLLTLLNDKYEKKNIYKEDAFARYLSGFFREGDKDWDGAFVDFTKAAKIYVRFEKDYGVAMPESLKSDLFRVARKAGRLADAAQIFPGYQPPEEPTRDTGMVVWVRLCGRIPEKAEDRIILPGPHGPLTIAFPRFYAPAVPGPSQPVMLVSDRNREIEISGDLASDIGAIAVKNLEDRRVRITAKALARAVAKQVVIHQAARGQNRETEEAVKTALNLINVLVEHADTRSWRTLPGQIYLGRARVAPGLWEASYQALGQTITKKLLVKANEIHYIVINDF